MKTNTRLGKLNASINFYQGIYIDIDRNRHLQKLLKKITLLENARSSEILKMKDAYTKSNFSSLYKKTLGGY